MIDSLLDAVSRELLITARDNGVLRRITRGKSRVLFELKGVEFLGMKTTGGRWVFIRPVAVIADGDMASPLREVKDEE